MSNTYVAIMAGGVGSRFWPGSRESRPKQFLDILGVGKSLIQLTYERFLKLCPKENIYIVTNKMYKALVQEHLPDLGEHQILCEPSRNNTAPCIAYTSFKLKATNPNANFVVAPSDALILKEDVFIAALQKAVDFTTSTDSICTLGITPTRPDTGYGYINFDQATENGVHKVFSFKEKPNLETAKGYLAAGGYVWNAGIFICSATTMINAFQEHSPEIYAKFDAIRAVFNTPKEQEVIDREYPTCPKISVDFAIMEKAANIYTIPVDIGWSDLGTWNSLHLQMPKDEQDNVVYGDDVLLYETENSFIRTPTGKLVVIKGLKDYIVVDDDNVLLVYPKSQEQEIKGITRAIKAGGKGEYL